MQLNYFNQPYFGNGDIEKISKVLTINGIKKPLICSDPGLSSIGMTDRIINLISDNFCVSFFGETPANPTEKSVNDALKIFKNNGCDGVVGFGGGSSMDLAKAVGLMASHGGNIIDYSVVEGGYRKINGFAHSYGTITGTGSVLGLSVANGVKQGVLGCRTPSSGNNYLHHWNYYYSFNVSSDSNLTVGETISERTSAGVSTGVSTRPSPPASKGLSVSPSLLKELAKSILSTLE